MPSTNTTYRLQIPALEEGIQMTFDEYHAWLNENARIIVDGEALGGQQGGSTPDEDVGLFINGTDSIEAFDEEKGKYVPITDVPIGSLLAWASAIATIPPNYLLCDGRTISREDYPDLFAVIGTTWEKSGDGDTVFRLPDGRARNPLGAGAGEYKSPTTGLTRVHEVGDYPGQEWLRHTTPWTSAPTGTRITNDILKASGGSVITDIVPPCFVVQWLIRYR